MIVHSARDPILLETPLQRLQSFITPYEHFFVRNNFDAPDVPREDWSLRIEGEVDNPLTLAFRDLKQFETVELTAWVQCAGNGRSFFDPPTRGTPWRRGAIGNAVWRGVRLRDVLLKAQPTLRARHVASRGADTPPAGTDFFARSITIDKALDPNTLLVFEMNGEPLPRLHGGPVRLLVPGWMGSQNTKWITHLFVTQEEWHGRFHAISYRVPAIPVEPGTRLRPEEMVATTRWPVNSHFTNVDDGQTLPAGWVGLKGLAYSGDFGVARVEVSVDGGGTWQPVHFTHRGGAHSWDQWEFVWNATPGEHVLTARATDTAGRTQPMNQRDIPWNPDGYIFNAVVPVRVTVTG